MLQSKLNEEVQSSQKDNDRALDGVLAAFSISTSSSPALTSGSTSTPLSSPLASSLRAPQTTSTTTSGYYKKIGSFIPCSALEVGRSENRSQTPGTDLPRPLQDHNHLETSRKKLSRSMLPRPSQDHSHLETSRKKLSRSMLPRPTMPQKMHARSRVLGSGIGKANQQKKVDSKVQKARKLALERNFDEILGGDVEPVVDEDMLC